MGSALSVPSLQEREDAARQGRNQRQEGLTAEYTKYAEKGLPPGSPSAYSAYSAVYLFPEGSSLLRRGTIWQGGDQVILIHKVKHLCRHIVQLQLRGA